MNKREWMLQAALTVIGTGREFTIDDIGTTLAETYDAIVAASPDTTWIEHRGEKPYPEGMVDVQFRDGHEQLCLEADDLIWTHGQFDGPEQDVVKWRPA